MDLKACTSNPSIEINDFNVSDQSSQPVLKISHSNKAHDIGIIKEKYGIISYLQDKLNEARSLRDFRVMVHLGIDLGDAYVNSRSYDNGRKFYMEALQLARKYNDSYSCGIACYKLAKLYSAIPNINLSLSYFFEFLNESKILGNTGAMCEAYKNISDLYAICGNKEFCLKYCQYYYVLVKKIDLGRSLAAVLVHINLLRKDFNLPEFTNDLIPGIYAEIFQSDIYNPQSILSFYTNPRNTIKAYDQSHNAPTQFTQFILWDKCHRKGILLYYMKKFDKAVRVFTENLAQTDKIMDNYQNKCCKAETIEKIGSCWKKLNRYSIAIEHFIDVKKIARELSDYVLEYAAICNLELCYKKMSEHGEENASDMYQYYKLQRLLMMEENREVQAIPIQKLTEIYFSAGNNDEVIRLFQIFLDKAKKNNNEFEIFVSHCHIGQAYFFQGLIIEASDAFQKAKMIATNAGKELFLQLVYFNLYQIYRLRNEWDRAKEELNAYLNLSYQIGDNFGKCLSFESMSDLHIELGDHKGAYEFAKKYLKYANILRDINEILNAGKCVDQMRLFEKDIPGTEINLLILDDDD